MIRRAIRHAMERSLLSLPPKKRSGKVLILAYHNVLPHQLNRGGDRSLHMDLERFEAQLSIVSSEAHVVGLTTIQSTQESESPRIVITFDDAYEGAIRYAVPACVSAGLPCTVFVAPKLLGKIPVWDAAAAAGNWSARQRTAYLTQSRGIGGHIDVVPENVGDHPLAHLRIADTVSLSAIAHSHLVSIGHHTANHANLGALSASEAVREVREAQKWVADHFGSAAVNWLAYPYGIQPVAVEKFASAAEIDGALLVEGGWWNPSRGILPHLPRWNVPAGVSDDGFRIRLRDRSLRS